jgi:hypothetical protein
VILASGRVLSPRYGPTPVYTDAGPSLALELAMTLAKLWTVHETDQSLVYAYGWSLCYAVDVVTLADAVPLAHQLDGYERAINHRWVHHSYVRVQWPDQPHELGLQVNTGGRGARGAFADGYPVIEWCVMVTWRSGGRWAGRKWLRLGLHQTDIVMGQLDPSIVALVESEYIAPIVAAGVYYTRSGVLISEGVVDPSLRLYGLRHGTNRRLHLSI